MTFQAIRRGLILTIPLLLIGSFCLIILNLPIPQYQEAIAQIPFIRPFFFAIHEITLGVFSLYVAFSISVTYAQNYASKYGPFFSQAAPLAAIGSYLLLAGLGTENFAISVLSTRSLFIAIVASLVSTAVYCRMMRRPERYKSSYGSGSDRLFDQALSALVPVIVIVGAAALFNTTISFLFEVDSVEELFFQGLSAFFPSDISSLESGLLYLFLNSLLWFFGMHGGNMLDGVAQSLFLPGTEMNAELIAAGMQATQIVTKTSLDVFASIGGGGAMLSLLIAILIFTRHRNIKRLAKLAAVPMVFNVSEIMLFGLPVIFNPAFLIPFIIVPMINLLIAYGAIVSGFMPYVSVDVSWITPPLIGGYIATGSYTGVVVQAVSLIVGALIYLPFLRIYEKNLDTMRHREFQSLLDRYKDSENEKAELVLTGLPGNLGLLVRSLADDLQAAIKQKSFDLHYQPQFNAADEGIGAEALLRWNHPVHGMMYPPLVIKLAEEIGVLDELEHMVFDKALDDMQRIQPLIDLGILAESFTVSVNATTRTLQSETFVENLIAEVHKRGVLPQRLILEATEHDAFTLTATTASLLGKLVDAGIVLAIDDFSMGHTSFKYLETSAFKVVKLDGGIARGVMSSPRFADIVTSIAKLSKQLNFKVLAEYVETREQKNQLEALGCEFFQGYLYSAAVPLEDMIAFVTSGQAKEK